MQETFIQDSFPADVYVPIYCHSSMANLNFSKYASFKNFETRIMELQTPTVQVNFKTMHVGRTSGASYHLLNLVQKAISINLKIG